MSEQNILNPTTTDALNPDYSVKVTDPQVYSRWQARSGKPFARLVAARGEVYELQWGKRMFADYQRLLQWFHAYESDFFAYADYDRGRYYSGMFADQPVSERAGNEQVNITAQFVAVPTLPLFQYPSNWARDAVMVEERANWPVALGVDGSVNDRVKLTGTWDRRDKNYALWSEQFNNAVWAIQAGCVVTPDAVTAPDGTLTADLLTSGNAGTSSIVQGVVAGAAEIYTRSLHMRAGTSSTIMFGILDTVTGNWVPVTVAILSGPGASAGGTPTSITGLTAAWTRVALTSTVALVKGRSYALYIYPKDQTANVLTNYVWGEQFEIAPAATTYTKTTSAAFTLITPTANASYHGGYAYFNDGTVTTDAIEWMYLGYGFRVWAPKDTNLGIVQVSLDGVVQGTVDLYAAARTAAAALFTVTNAPLGMHRVKLSPTNTKNAASSAVIVCGDAIEVMR